MISIDSPSLAIVKVLLTATVAFDMSLVSVDQQALPTTGAAPPVVPSAGQPSSGLESSTTRVMPPGATLLTEADKAVIRANCDYSDGEWDGVRLHFRGGAITCNNGTDVSNNPQMRAVSSRVLERLRNAR